MCRRCNFCIFQKTLHLAEGTFPLPLARTVELKIFISQYFLLFSGNDLWFGIYFLFLGSLIGRHGMYGHFFHYITKVSLEIQFHYAWLANEFSEDTFQTNNSYLTVSNYTNIFYAGKDGSIDSPLVVRMLSGSHAYEYLVLNSTE